MKEGQKLYYTNISKSVGVGFSFCLYPTVRGQYSINFLKNRTLLECKQAFTMANNMASSGLWGKSCTYHRWPHSYAKRGTWCQAVWYQMLVLWDPIPTKCWWCKHSVQPPCEAGGGEPIWSVGQGIKQCLMQYVGKLVLINVPIEGWVINPYEHGPPWWSWQWYVTPYPLWRNCPVFMLIRGVGMVIDGGKCSEMLLNISPKILADSPMYISPHFNLSLLYLCVTPLSGVILALSLGAWGFCWYCLLLNGPVYLL